MILSRYSHRLVTVPLPTRYRLSAFISIKNHFLNVFNDDAPLRMLKDVEERYGHDDGRMVTAA